MIHHQIWFSKYHSTKMGYYKDTVGAQGRTLVFESDICPPNYKMPLARCNVCRCAMYSGVRRVCCTPLSLAAAPHLQECPRPHRSADRDRDFRLPCIAAQTSHVDAVRWHATTQERYKHTSIVYPALMCIHTSPSPRILVGSVININRPSSHVRCNLIRR